MAKKRMFSQEIVESDAFTEMSLQAQALYFHLCMYADDDGFVQPKKVMAIIGAKNKDFLQLLNKNFIISFKSGVILVKHWKINNTIQNDRLTHTTYLDEFKIVKVKPNKSYSLNEGESVTELYPKCFQNGNNMLPQIRLDKDRLDKISKDNINLENNNSNGKTNLQIYIDCLKKEQAERRAEIAQKVENFKKEREKR